MGGRHLKGLGRKEGPFREGRNKKIVLHQY